MEYNVYNMSDVFAVNSKGDLTKNVYNNKKKNDSSVSPYELFLTQV